ncbi:hypothetical protein Swit_2215 [Rhizorhabdus wittichii RW1]|uniref:Uncharacterized protein n=1 Tax=Rhizorhabdus wittichii (strain DSM 6014 / CCUG 31198 / JCM 15750 / NBRC 105917 / EY 4224 / RW1) TaxID=392499 RepID=A0A9J9HBU8_RHIWR|nr:hypothetical protein Swit_2215 [Rhizorhabdus wittichii RW1]
MSAITYRISWPRPATPCALQPKWAGEFRNFDDWVSFATTRLTGTVDNLTGSELRAICVDALGRRCTMGAHFMRARDDDAFPVRYFWELEPVAPEFDSAARLALPLIEADRASFFDCHTVGGDPASLSDEEARMIAAYDAAICALASAVAKGNGRP